jgi:hypothetical protein
MIALSPKTVPSLFGLTLAIALHVGVIILLLSDHIKVAYLPVAHLITTRIIYEPNPFSQPLKLHENQLAINVRIEPPQIPGLEIIEPPPTINTPLVKIGARFEPGFDTRIPIEEIRFSHQAIGDRTVGLAIQIYEDGGVGEVQIEHTSGLTEIDEFMARYAKLHWHFIPATQDGEATASWKSIDIVFAAKTISVVQR